MGNFGSDAPRGKRQKGLIGTVEMQDTNKGKDPGKGKSKITKDKTDVGKGTSDEGKSLSLQLTEVADRYEAGLLDRSTMYLEWAAIHEHDGDPVMATTCRRVAERLSRQARSSSFQR